MAAVDTQIVSAGKEPGSFSALSYQLINSDDQIEELAQGSGVAEAMGVYRNVCSRITKETDPFWQGEARIRPLTEDELAAVGLAAGKKMPMVKVNEAARESALRELAKWPRGGFSVEPPYRERRWLGDFKIESRSYWLGAVGDSKQAATYLIAPPELRTYEDGTPRDTERSELFFPKNCAELYKTIQLGIEEFRAATELRFAKMRAERNVTDSYDSAGYKSTAALAKAIGKLQQASSGSGLGAAISKVPLLGWAADMAEANIVMTLAKLIQGFSEWVGKYVLLILPGAAALAIFLAALYYPISSLFALLPNQLGRLSTLFWLVAWCKLTLLGVYVSLRICGAFSLGLAKIELAPATGTGGAAVMLVTTVGAMIVAMLSPFVARSLIWNDSYGLASQIGFGRGAVIGAAAFAATRGAGAAAKVATKVTVAGTKVAGAGLRGAGRIAAGVYRSSLDGGGVVSAGRTTAKHLRDRISRMSGK